MGRILRITFVCLLIAALFICSSSCQSVEEIPEDEPPAPLIEQPLGILRSDTAGNTVVKAAIELRNVLAEHGLDIKIDTDWVKRDEEIPPLNRQIVVGITNREIVENYYNSLRGDNPGSNRDWSISEIDGSVVILGVTDEALLEALDYFNENYICEGGIAVPQNLSYTYRHSYRRLSVDGVDILDFGVNPAEIGFLSPAEYLLRSSIPELTGGDIPEKSDRMISVTVDSGLRDNTYSIRADRNGIDILGSSYDAANYGAYRFMEMLNEKESLPAVNETDKAVLCQPDTSVPQSKGTYTSVGDPVYLIEDSDYVHSGWSTVMAQENYKFDGMMEKSHALGLSITGSKYDQDVYMYREFLPQSGGTLLFETSLTLSKADGLTISFSDSDEKKTAFSIDIADGKIKTAGSAPVNCSAALLIRAEINLDESSYTAYIGSKCLGTFGFAQKVRQLDTLTLYLAPGKEIKLTPNFVYLANRISAADRFLTMTAGEAPVGYVTDGNVSVVGNHEVLLKDKSSMKKQFSAFDGKAIFEWKFNSGNYDADTSFTIADGDTSAISLQLSGIAINVGGKPVRFYNTDFWYQVRVEADTRTKRAEILINGKTFGYFPFENEVSSFDGLTIKTGKDDTLNVDDIFIYQENDHEDYCPAPLSEGSDGYYVAMQSCSLWRNGVQWGWDCITPFDEIKPYLGYYDEGNPELADWEIKYMAEHGIDYELYCWFNPTVSSPIKMPLNANALHDGYFNARYSNSMKFAIMWENLNGYHPGNSANFRKYIVPYWVEYYFKDPRYMVIDNKPVVTVFSLENLYADFGSREAVTAELDYLRDVCKGLGYDGVYIWTSTANRDAINIGMDATYRYSWSKNNTSGAITDSIKGQYRSVGNTVATASVGFNDVAWHQTRSELFDPDDYRKLLEWIRDEYSQNYDADNYIGKSVVLATWNEYGEGHYLMPSGLHGFDYLDAIREVYAPDNAYENIVPTDSQQARIGTLFPQDRQMLRAHYQEDLTAHDTVTEIKSWDFSKDLDGWDDGFGLSSYTAKDGTLHGTSRENDFAVYSAENLNIDVTAAVSLEVTMKCNKNGMMEVFYITDKGPRWKQEQSVSAAVSASDDFVTYIMSISGQPALSGKLLQLRVDPLQSGCEFEIAGVKIYGVNEIYAAADGDKEVLQFSNHKPYISGGDAMIPIDPVTGIVTYLGYGYRWNGKTDTVTIFNNAHTVSFTVGSDIASADGKEVTLSRKVEDFDGLPVLPMDDMNRLLGTSLRLVNLLDK